MQSAKKAVSNEAFTASVSGLHLVIEPEPWLRIFLRNIADLFRATPPPVWFTSRPAEYWADALVRRPLAWRDCDTADHSPACSRLSAPGPLRRVADANRRVANAEAGQSTNRRAAQCRGFCDAARRAWRPAQATRVKAGVPIKRAGVKPLGEVLKKAVSVALSGIGLQVFEKHPDGPSYLGHPRQAAVVTTKEVVVEQRLQDTRWRQYHRKFRVHACQIGMYARLDRHKHVKWSVSGLNKATSRDGPRGGASTTRRITTTSPTLRKPFLALLSGTSTNAFFWLS